MRTARAYMFFALLVAACSDGGDSDPTLFQSEPVACGALTCSATEMCVKPQSLGPWFEQQPESETCAATPAGCGGLELCGCTALQDEYEGLAIVGCSLLGERSIYVADVTCGDRRCSEDEYCLLAGEAGEQVPSSRECRPLPAECEASQTFCGTDSCSAAISIDGFTVMGCMESDSVRALRATPAL